MTLSSRIVMEGARTLATDLKRKFYGVKRYSGSAKEICEKIVLDCWNGEFFQVSTGHFCQFYSRDFGWCTESLLQLGHRKKVLSTLDYALSRFVEAGSIHVAITPQGKPWNFPNYPSIDSVAYFFRSLRLAKADSLINTHRHFLERELQRVSSYVLPEGILSPDIRFSGMRDYAIRRSACYDNTFLAMLAKEADLLGLTNPLRKFNFKKVLKERFWNGEYFKDDLENGDFTADANIYPFILGVFDAKKDKRMLQSIIFRLEQEGLDAPFPLKYSANKNSKMLALEWLVPGWEQDCVWAHMGLPYIALLAKIDKKKAKEHLRRYEEIILREGNFRELYSPDGIPYSSWLYLSDEGMLWAANFLSLKKSLG